MTTEDARYLDYGIAASVRALVTAMGMHAENQHRLHCGMGVAYGEEAFQHVLDSEGVTHNNVVTRWQR